MTTKEERDSFSIKIESIAVNEKISHMEAIIDYCENTGLEVEIAGTLCNTSLKAKIEAEARDLRFLPKGSKLPL